MADRGGGVQGVRTPLLGHDVGFLTLGPKLDPPLFLLVDPRWTPVADPGCVCGGVFQFLWGRMTSRRQCPRGGCLWMSKSGGVFQIFWGRMTSRGQCAGRGACEKSCIRAWTPPPLSKILDPRLWRHVTLLWPKPFFFNLRNLGVTSRDLAMT